MCVYPFISPTLYIPATNSRGRAIYPQRCVSLLPLAEGVLYIPNGVYTCHHVQRACFISPTLCIPATICRGRALYPQHCVSLLQLAEGMLYIPNAVYSCYHMQRACFISPALCIVMQSKKKHVFFNTFFFFKNHCPKKLFLCFFLLSTISRQESVFLLLGSAYSCYIQVVKHYIQYVNCIFIDSETNYLMNYNANLHSNIKLHNYNL